jgi:dTDP-4-amino-4,6-dideoxygalactose transaminase
MLNAQLNIARPVEEIHFVDLGAQRRRIGDAMDRAVIRAVNDGKYILGPQVAELEKELARRSQVKHVIGCANGTDALALVLMAKGVRPGDAIFVPAFTFVATAEVVAWLGATPFFVDVLSDTFNIDPESLKQAIIDAKQMGLKPRAVIPVDLFGQPADYRAILPLAQENDLWVLADAAQSFGASLDGKPVGSWGTATSTSFFPAKPLGCYGDGGAVFTNDDELAKLVRSIHFHGKGADKYENVRIGVNSRLDTIQAAILLEKLKIFDDEIAARQVVADRYTAALSDRVHTPKMIAGATSAWAQYTLVPKKEIDRSGLIEQCKLAGIPIMVYYPVPLSQQTGYKHYPSVKGGVAVSEELSRRVFSLPMHPYLECKQQEYIADTVVKALNDNLKD